MREIIEKVVTKFFEKAPEVISSAIQAAAESNNHDNITPKRIFHKGYTDRCSRVYDFTDGSRMLWYA